MPRSVVARADRGLIRDGHLQRHVQIDVVAPSQAPRGPLSFGLALDRSGSMAGPKLRVACEGAIRAIRSLRPEDQLSVVCYSDEAQSVVRSGAATDSMKRVAERRVREVVADGNTDLCAGWLRACEQVALGTADGRLGRCLLLTDGRANLGITDHPTLVRHAAELRRRGVTTSTLGVGADFDEQLLREMAEAGGGGFYFAEGADRLAGFIAGETGEAQKVVAREAALVVEVPPGTSITSPNPFRMRSERCRSVIELGDLVADQVLSLVVTLAFPRREEGERALLQCWLWDPAAVLDGSAELEFRYATSEAYAAERRDRDVDREVVVAYAAAARRSALELARQGSARKGRLLLRSMADEVRRHAGGDASLVALADELAAEAARFERMDRLDYKRLEYSSFGALYSRGEDGMTIGTMSFTLDLAMQAARLADSVPFRVAAVTSDRDATGLVEGAGGALAAADSGAFAWTVVNGGARILDCGAGVRLSRDEELALVYALAATGAPVKIGFVRGLLEDEALSHWHAGEGAAVVSLSAWPDPPGGSVALVAHEMVLAALRHRCPAWSLPAHRDRRGCWGDFGSSAADAAARIEAGDLCPACRQQIAAAGVEASRVVSLVQAVQRLSGRPAGVPG